MRRLGSREDLLRVCRCRRRWPVGPDAENLLKPSSSFEGISIMQVASSSVRRSLCCIYVRTASSTASIRTPTGSSSLVTSRAPLTKLAELGLLHRKRRRASAAVWPKSWRAQRRRSANEQACNSVPHLIRACHLELHSPVSAHKQRTCLGSRATVEQRAPQSWEPTQALPSHWRR